LSNDEKVGSRTVSGFVGEFIEQNYRRKPEGNLNNIRPIRRDSFECRRLVR